MKLPVRCFIVALVSLNLPLLELSGLTTYAEEFSGDKLVIFEYLVLPPVGRYGRVPIHVDPLQATLVKGSWRAPYAGASFLSHGGRALTWNSVRTDSTGWLEHSSLRGGYAYAQVIASERQVVLLEASGHAMVYINGKPRVGDPYLTGQTILPIVLEEGSNELLFHCAAGKLRVEIFKPLQDVFLDRRDMTLPSLVEGEASPVWLGILLANCRETALDNCQISASLDAGSQLISKVGSIPPLSVRKIAVPLDPRSTKSFQSSEKVPVTLSLTQNTQEGTTSLATTSIELAMVTKDRLQTRTYRSNLDQSVQAYDVLPGETTSDENHASGGLLVWLHNSVTTPVEHLTQTNPLPGITLLAPSGRRVLGCDWEDWSLASVLECVEDVGEHVLFDPRRVWLRGKGTGGHGVLRLGSTTPNRWAALATVNAWLEYRTGEASTEKPQSPIASMMARVHSANQLFPLLSNTSHAGILLESIDSHSSNTVDDSRLIAQKLSTVHPDFVFRKRDTSKDQTMAGGSDDVLKFLRDRIATSLSESVLVDCVTFDPGRNSQVKWLTILQQIVQGSLSRATVRYLPEQNMFHGVTTNVAALQLSVEHLQQGTMVEVALDGETLGQFALDTAQLVFVRDKFGWHPAPEIPPVLKQPQRYGGFRSVFDHQPILVYGTQGSADENAWALAKARYDAETWLVRANGSLDIMADTDFDPRKEPDRNVVLYGNADVNSSWPRLLSTSPVQVRRGSITIDRRPELGDDLACLFVRPRSQSSTALVGVVGGTGITGMRATDRMPYFVHGVNYPDLLLLSAESLIQGNSEILAAGYFGLGWAVNPGEIVWRDIAL